MRRRAAGARRCGQRWSSGWGVLPEVRPADSRRRPCRYASLSPPALAKLLPAAQVGYVVLDEITVTRQLVIGGRSRYLINGKVAEPT